tara:strand:+ start:260 stop:1279 length:1020 start_codon:yes stop_codon:yes gene_type:complete
MAVRVSKPAFNLRSKLNELDRPVGVFGNQVLATENRYDASKLIGGGRKNFLINGDFKISQRGTYTSATAVTDDAYYLDRWKMRESGTAISITHNKNISITEAGADGIKTNAIKIDITSSNNGYWAIRQIVEDYAAVSGQTVTFSCWVRGVGPKVFFRLWSIGNIGHGHALTEDWQLYTETFTLPAFTQAADSSNGCAVTIGNYAEANVYNHTNDWCELALFQVEIGRSPTPFEFRTEAEELALCQRYFENINLYGANTTYTGGGYNRHIGEVFWKVEKRAIPSCNGPSVGNYQPGGGSGTVSISGPTIHGGILNSGNTNSTYPDGWINGGSILTVDAEL